MAKNTPEAPATGPYSYYFNALHDAMKAGDDGDKALAKAVVAETVSEPGGIAAIAADPFADFDKPGLQQRARDLGIAFESDANMDRLKELLRGHPDGVPQAQPEGVIVNEPDAPAAEPVQA